MAAEPQVVEMTLESTLESVAAAEEVTTEVCSKAGFDEEEQHRIEMAVHESMINAVSHGNKYDAHKRVRVRFQTYPDRLEIHIRDQGLGFEIGHVPNPLQAENLLKVSGRGIFLIRSFVDEFRVERPEGNGTEVILVKRKNLKKNPDQGGKHREHEGENAPR